MAVLSVWYEEKINKREREREEKKKVVLFNRGWGRRTKFLTSEDICAITS